MSDMCMSIIRIARPQHAQPSAAQDLACIAPDSSKQSTCFCQEVTDQSLVALEAILQRSLEMVHVPGQTLSTAGVQ